MYLGLFGSKEQLAQHMDFKIGTYDIISPKVKAADIILRFLEYKSTFFFMLDIMLHEWITI